MASAEKPPRRRSAPKKAASRKTAAPRRQPIAADEIVTEPDWARLLTDPAEVAAAAEHWRRVTTEMLDLQTLSPANGHSLQRLILAYLVYDRCALQVAADGLVTEPNAANPKAIARLSIYYKAMREAESTTERLEAQLGLSPGRRGKVGKVSKKKERRAGADAFLGPEG